MSCKIVIHALLLRAARTRAFQKNKFRQKQPKSVRHDWPQAIWYFRGVGGRHYSHRRTNVIGTKVGKLKTFVSTTGNNIVFAGKKLSEDIWNRLFIAFRTKTGFYVFGKQLAVNVSCCQHVVSTGSQKHYFCKYSVSHHRI